MTLCVYAVTGDASRSIRAKGMAGERLRLIACGPVSAAVGTLTRCPTVTPARLARYARVVETLSHQAAALLPARFGTCVGDADELMTILRSRRASLVRSLRHVRNRVQMTIRVIDSGFGIRDSGVGDSGVGDVGVGDAGVRGSGFAAPGSIVPVSGEERPSGGAYLRARAAEAARQRRVAGFDPLERAVRRWIRDERVDKRLRVATVYHLIPRASVSRYERALRTAAETSDLPIVVSGPFPPYAFAEV